MTNFDIKYVIFREELDLLRFYENQSSEKSRNEDLYKNHEID